MARESGPGPDGLRERKKRRTRMTLIDVAAELCLRDGYENTTVERIAAAAEVSPRTFSRYFPTKEAVIAAIADDVDEYVAKALARQPMHISEYEALFRAHIETYRPGSPGPSRAFSRMSVLAQIVNASPTLTGAAFAFQQGHASQTTVVLAHRMGLSPDDAAVRLVADVWTSVFAVAVAEFGVPGGESIDAATWCDRLTWAFELFTRACSPWNVDPAVNGDPPQASIRNSDYLHLVQRET